MNTLAVMCMAFTSTSPSRTPDFSTARVTSRVMLTNARRSGISSARYSVWLFMAGHRSTARAGVAGACKSPAAGDAPRIDRPPFAAPRRLSPPATERPGEPPSASSTTFDARSKTLSSNGLPDIVILSGARTPMAEWVGGKRGDGQNGGALAGVSAIDLGASAARAALDRADVLPGMLDHVVMGNALQTSADAIYGARHVGLKAGVSDECPALTVNRLCGSGFQSVASAAQLLQLGEAQWVLAGGMENMSQAPHVLRGARGGVKLGPGPALEDSLFVALKDSYCGLFMAQTSDNLARKYGITRQQQDEFALRSHDRANKANNNGRFAQEIVPVEVKQGKKVALVEKDDHLFPGTSIDRLPARPPPRSAPSRWSQRATRPASSTARPRW